MRVHELFSLKGQVALVTGGAGLLGAQMAEALADAGADVVIAGRNLEQCQVVAQAIAEGFGVKVMAVRLDVTDPDEVGACVEQVVAGMGQLNVLVNNAGIARKALLDSARLEDWKAVLDTNLTGVFLCSQAAARQMMRQRQGKIINIASIYGMVGVDQRLYEESPGMVPGSVPYTASKGGVVNMTRDMAVYLAPYNIQVNCISPGGFRSGQDQAFLARYNWRVPAGRMGGPDDLKGAVVFLASRASDYVTGHNLVVDGGWTAW
ncbi:MAG: SDR family oxidoreductase [Clostridia bacterium]|nr:MAG: SDR family oxidoreductase [Clostridia bacterium]